ncbi:MAG: heavy metal-binding domain-containing protein [Chloroflexota bacterium]|nr:heavy metal-binding domain-containing protein [Chloroflexia bacterium]MDQ3167207.1 heavy metal-binding domain-containing protein [Chloroflexota bacterium]MDQ3512130.1 heavy metal-binding domain-containing protein [Chloroflexota bacterium]
MILTTTSHLDGRPIQRYLGLVSGEAILGANVFRDVLAGVRDVIGGRSGSYEKELRRAKELAVQEMSEQAAAAGANAIIGIDLDYESLGANGSMLMVTASGTAVYCEGLTNV